jgi:transcription antitermination factor NusG
VDRLANHGLESFLPLYRSIRFWKDRRKELELPLFPGYVFVHASLNDRVRLLQVPGIVQFIAFNGQPAPVPECEIESLRRTLAAHLGAEPYPYLKLGRRVRLRGGPLAGLEGVLVDKKRKLRFVLSIDLIQRSVAVEVDAEHIEPLP